MSYLGFPRLHFYGECQADISTVNFVHWVGVARSYNNVKLLVGNEC